MSSHFGKKQLHETYSRNYITVKHYSYRPHLSNLSSKYIKVDTFLLLKYTIHLICLRIFWQLQSLSFQVLQHHIQTPRNHPGVHCYRKNYFHFSYNLHLILCILLQNFHCYCSFPILHFEIWILRPYKNVE